LKIILRKLNTKKATSQHLKGKTCLIAKT